MAIRLICHVFMLLGFAAQLVFSQQAFFEKCKIDNEQFYNTRGAILLKNREPTTCEIGLLGLKAGIVSANCFDFKDNGEVDENTDYHALFYDGKLDSRSFIWKISPSNIHIHPSFQISTLIYNLAVVEFNQNGDSSYQTFIVGDKYDVKASSYVFRPYNTSSYSWDTPRITSQQDDMTAICNDEDGLYRANPHRMSCNNATFSSYNNTCAIPNSALYTIRGGNVALVALYSHSIILGTDMCSSTWINIYSYVQYYISFIEDVLNRPIDIIYKNKPANTSIAIFSDLQLSTPEYVNMTGKLVVGGNLYEAQYQKGKKSGSNKKKTIIIGVAAPVGAIIVALGTYAAYKLRKRAQIRRNRSLEERLHLYELANELAVDTEPSKPPSLRAPEIPDSSNSTPPSYFATISQIDYSNRDTINTISESIKSPKDELKR